MNRKIAITVFTLGFFLSFAERSYGCPTVPIANIKADSCFAVVGQTITLDGNDSNAGCDGNINSWEWDPNYDGTTFRPDSNYNENQNIINHTYTSPGIYTVALRVKDSCLGELSGMAYFKVYVGSAERTRVFYVKKEAAGSGESWENALGDINTALLAAQNNGGGQIWVSEGNYIPSKRTNTSDLRTATFQLVNGVGLYGGFSGSGTTRLSEDFSDGDFNGWALANESDQTINWAVSSGKMVQGNLVGHIENGIAERGTYAWRQNGTEWKDYRVNATMQSAGYGSIGIMFRYQDANNYYRFSMDYFYQRRLLIKKVGGTVTLLAADLVSRVMGQTYNTAITAQGNTLRVVVDGNVIFSVIDNSLAKGSVALYSYRDNASTFDDVIVTEYPTRAWETYPTVLSGDLDHNDVGGIDDPTRGENAYHVVTGTGTDANAVLDGFIIERGNANRDPLGYYGKCGGGIYNDSNNSSISSNPSIYNCTFQYNFANYKGGAMFDNNSSSPIVRDCVFKNNHANLYGGAIFNWSLCNPTFINCIISDNKATNGNGIASTGGGVCNWVSSHPTFINCIIYKNEGGVPYGGGGVRNANCTATFKNCSILYNNSSGNGGGVYNSSTYCEMDNCIIWGNTVNLDFSPQVYNDTSSSSIVRYSCVQDIEANDSSIPFNGDGDANHNIDDNPMFVSVDGNDYRLQAGSPCIDKGDTNAVPPGITTDVNGISRKLDGDGNGISVVDMGAYEYQGSVAVVTIANPGGPYVVIDGSSDDGDHAINGGADIALDGSASTGSSLTYIWYSGGEEVIRGTTPQVRFGIGNTVIGLLVIDGWGNWDYAETTVTVNWPVSGAKIEAGEPQTTYLPLTGPLQLHGQDTNYLDPNDIIKKYEWQVLKVPDGGGITWPDGVASKYTLAPNITLVDGIRGEYEFMLIGKDSSDDNVASDTTTITVKSTPASNAAPVVNAWILDSSGQKRSTIDLSASTVTLQGTITDDGQISGELTGIWKQLYGPINGVTINPLTANCSKCEKLNAYATATFTKNGTYQLYLEGTDGTLTTMSSIVLLNVGLPPDVQAGENHHAVIDANTGQVYVTMSDAKVTDRYGSDNTDKQWSLMEGNSAHVQYLDGNNIEKPTIIFTQQGTYKFKLTAIDPDISGPPLSDTVCVLITESPIVTPNPRCTALYAGVSYKDAGNARGAVYRREVSNVDSEWVSLKTFDAPVLSLCEYHGDIYVGTGDCIVENNKKYPQAEVWKCTKGMNWKKISDDTQWPDYNGINSSLYDTKILGVTSLAVYNNKLFAALLGDFIYRCDVAETNTWTRITGVPSWIDFRTEIACAVSLYSWNGYLYLGAPGYDKIDRYSGGYTSERVLNVMCGNNNEADCGSCIWDFAIYGDSLYSSAAYYHEFPSPTQIYTPVEGSNGSQWEGVTGSLFDDKTSWTIQEYKGLLYCGAGNGLRTYDKSNGDFHKVPSDNDPCWTDANGDVLSLESTEDNLFIGTGCRRGPHADNDLFGDQGQVYELSIHGGTINIVNYSEGLGTEIEGIQCLLAQPMPCEPEHLTMSVEAFVEDSSNSTGWVDAAAEGRCVSTESFSEIKYEITIDPKGQADAQDLVLTVALPDTVDFVTADDNSVYDANARAVIWLFNDISSEDSVKRTLIVEVNEQSVPGDYILTVVGLENEYFQCVINDRTPKICCSSKGILYVNKNISSGMHNGQSWETAFDNLSDAIRVADGSGCYSQIWVAAGIYSPRSLKPFTVQGNSSIYGGFHGNESSIDERDFTDSANITILSGDIDDDNDGDCDYVVDARDNSVVDGFYIQKGRKGGVLLRDSSGTISHCWISNNGSGAIEDASIGVRYSGDSGIYLSGLTNAQIINCMIYSNHGQGIAIWKVNLTQIVNPRIRNNTIVDNERWGIYIFGGTTTVTKCIIWGNTGDHEGVQACMHQFVGCIPYNCYIECYHDYLDPSNSAIYTKDSKDPHNSFGNGVGGLNDFDVTRGGYHLKPDAQSIDAGDDSSGIGEYETDIDGEPRIIGVGIDIGADEFPPLWVEAHAGGTIYKVIPAGASSVQVNFSSATIIDSGALPSVMSYQWTCMDHPGNDGPQFVGGISTELNPRLTFTAWGWYKFLLRVRDASNIVIGSDVLYVWIGRGAEIVVKDKNPVNRVGSVKTYESYVNEELGLEAHFDNLGLPPKVVWCSQDAPVKFEDQSLIDATVTFDTPGWYPLDLYALNDNGEIIGEDHAWINVGYQQYKVSAGQNRVLYLEKKLGTWQVTGTFYGYVDGIDLTSADSVNWFVEAADDDANFPLNDPDNPSFDSNNPTKAEITFTHSGQYYVLFSVWRDGEFLGTGVALVTVMHRQVEVSIGDYVRDGDGIITILYTGVPKELSMEGKIVQGQVDSVEWVCVDLDPLIPSQVKFANPKSLSTKVTFVQCGIGYPITLLGKKKIDGIDIIVASDTGNFNYVDGALVFTPSICVRTQTEDSSSNVLLPFTTHVLATINEWEENCEGTTSYEDYDYAEWSWSGMDNSVEVNQTSTKPPRAEVKFNRPGEYVLMLVVKKGNSLVTTAKHLITVTELGCVDANAGFNTDMSVKQQDVNIGSTICVYSQINQNCPNQIAVERYWSCKNSAGSVTFNPVDACEPNVTFTKPGDYPLTLCVVNKQTRELLASPTIFASVKTSRYTIDITGNRIITPNTQAMLTATILGGAPNGSTCTWSTNDSNISLPPNTTVESNEPITFTAAAFGEHKLTVRGNVNEPVTRTISVYASQDLSSVLYPGSTKYVTLPELAHMSDAVFITNISGVIPLWSLESKPSIDAEVSFFPNVNSENPYVFLSKPGKYTLKLAPSQGSDPEAKTVDVYVYAPVVSDPNGPTVKLNVTKGDANNLKILTATAEDNDGVSTLAIELGGMALEETSGYPSYNQKLTLRYIMDISRLPAGTNYIHACANDIYGNRNQSGNESFTNDSTNTAFSNFSVTPETVTSPAGALTFTASFYEASDWNLKIYPFGASSNDSNTEYSGHGDDLDKVVSTSTGGIDWPDGRYKAVLMMSDSIGEVYFSIMRGSISSGVNAQLVSFDGNTSGNVSLYYDTDYDSPPVRITDGRGKIYARLGNIYFPDEVEYKLEICRADGIYLVPIQTITPSDVPHDAQGWAKKSSNGFTEEDLGTIDLSMLENGSYFIKLSVWCNGNDIGNYDYTPFILDCPLKIGNLKFSQEDLVVETGGVPLRVVRTYDSFKKNEQGEFGYGWTYSIANLDIELDETRVDMFYDDGWDCGGTPIEIRNKDGGDFASRNVTLTLPDGRRTTFMFNLDSSNKAVYESMPGVNAKLRTKNDEILGQPNWFNGWCWEGITHGPTYDSGGVFTIESSQYDFSGFILTTEDGTEYTFEREEITHEPEFFTYCSSEDMTSYYTVVRGQPYLTSIKTANCEQIRLNTNLTDGKIGANGIQFVDANNHPSNKKLNVGYDSSNRISYIDAPSEVNTAFHTIVYEYTEGNLTKVKKLVSKDPVKYDVTDYTYEDSTHKPADHFVTDIKDARGLTPIRYVYDAAGRLTETIDAKGNRIVIDHDVTGKAEMVYERWDTAKDYPAVYIYNDRGNVEKIQKFDYSGSPKLLDETRYTYDANPLGRDNPVLIEKAFAISGDTATDWAKSQNRYTYADDGRVTRHIAIDPENIVTETCYDANNNVTDVYQGMGWQDSNSSYTPVSRTHNTYEGSNLKATSVWDPADNTKPMSMSVNVYDSLNRIRHAINVNLDAVADVSPFYTIVFNPQNDNIRTNYAVNHSVTTYSYNDNELQPSSVQDPSGAVTFFAYDDNGRQYKSWYHWVDPDNAANDCNVYTISIYDAAGRVVETLRDVNDVHGNVEKSTITLSQTFYNSIGKVDESFNELDCSTKYHYDQTGNLVETDTYDPNGDLMTVSRTLYDTEGRAIVAVGPYEPNVYNGPAAKWPVGTETVYDVLGRAVETRRWAGVKVDLVPFKVSGSGQTVPCADNDPSMAGKMVLLGVSAANAWSSTGSPTAPIGWTSDGNLPTVKTSLDTSSEVGPLSYNKTVYDVAGRVLYSISLDGDSAEQVTSYGYDKAGKQTSVTDPCGHTVSRTSGIILHNGNHASEITGDIGSTGTHCTYTFYDGTRRDHVTDANNQTTSFTYDCLGRVIQTTYPPKTTGGSNIYVYVGYDGLGRKIWESKQTTKTHEQLTNQDKKEFEYDSAGRLIAVTLPQNDEMAVPDHNGVTLVDARTRHEYVYDAYGNMIEQWDDIYVKGGVIIDTHARVTRFTYDHLHNQITRELGGETEYKAYDEYGRIYVAEDFKGQVTGFEYNALGQLGYKKYYENQTKYDANDPCETVSYIYDNLGRKIEVTDSRGTTTYTYDAEGRILSVVSPEGTVNYAYDPITGQKINTNTASTETQFDYDAMGRLNATELVKRNGSSVSELTTYEYTAVGNRSKMHLPNGVTTSYGYDNLNRLFTLTHYDGASTPRQLGSYTYTLNAEGRRDSIAEELRQPGVPGGSPDPVTETHGISYTYDNLNRLLTEQATDGASHGYNIEYKYDVVGNRLERKLTVNTTQKVKTTYTYNAQNDRLESEQNTTFSMLIPGHDDRPIYAYVSNGHITSYGVAGLTNPVGHFRAFLLGLPSRWASWLFIAALILIPISFFGPVVGRAFSKTTNGPRPHMSLLHRCLCVLLAYLMLIGPEWFQSLAQAASVYDNMSNSAWAQQGMTVTYQYDANGSMTSKVVTGTSNNKSYNYDYNLRNQLKCVTASYTSGGNNISEVTEYAYNDDGIRVKSVYKEYVNGSLNNNSIETKVFLIDSQNHTGYSQVLEELVYDHTQPNPNPLTDAPTSRKTYTIGDDVITQSTGNNPQHLLYDGHGSTRQLAGLPDGQQKVGISEYYSYDAYGVMVDGNPNSASPTQTNMLYAGEQWDNSAQMYYLRARYYDPLNGRFNQMDSFAGNNEDPQSLHKYLYCHANPVNAIDPSGAMDISLISVMGVMANIARTFMAYYPVLRVGFFVADILDAAAIVMKALTQGISSVTAREWANLALITATAFFGGKIARQVAKRMINWALKIPAGICHSFETLANFVKSKGIIIGMDYTTKTVVKGGKEFEVLGEFVPIDKGIYTELIITLREGGRNISTLLHEYTHYIEWKKFVGSGGRWDWNNFRSIGNYDEYLEHIAYFVSDVFSKS
jgi:RHS repeat-associated protein